VEFDQSELRIEVVDSGTGASVTANGTGRGVVGMQERVAMYGGRLDAGPQSEGGFVVRARLPIETA
jgi:signal transduction histidine kinase